MTHRHGAGRTRKTRRSTRHPMADPGYLHRYWCLQGPALALYRRAFNAHQDKIKEEA